MREDDNWTYDPTEAAGEQEADAPLRYEIMNYPADTTLGGYVEMWDRDELIIPEFQREYVWDQVKASKLIESFLLRLPVPAVFLFKPADASGYLIVDGQQRIKSVVSYIKGTFGDKVFRLKGLATQWEGQKFDDLTEKEQFELRGTVLRATIIHQIDPKDDTSIYQIFERLNTGGVNLSPMEIRQCVSHGPFIQFLKNLNKDGNWRKILGKPRTDKRLRDVELILRCFALFENAEKYEKPMKGFLNKYAESAGSEGADYEKLGRKFEKACTEIVGQLGEKPFHLRKRLNYGLMDSILTGVMRNPDCGNISDVVEALKASEHYEASITKNTSDAVEVKCRLDLAAAAFGARGTKDLAEIQRRIAVASKKYQPGKAA